MLLYGTSTSKKAYSILEKYRGFGRLTCVWTKHLVDREAHNRLWSIHCSLSLSAWLQMYTQHSVVRHWKNQLPGPQKVLSAGFTRVCQIPSIIQYNNDFLIKYWCFFILEYSKLKIGFQYLNYDTKYLQKPKSEKHISISILYWYLYSDFGSLRNLYS